MGGFGLTLILIGIGSFILPLLGLQFSLLSILGDSIWARLGIVVVGIALVIFSPRQKQD
jgi:hypothetical protein